jgi:hypothetical protein
MPKVSRPVIYTALAAVAAYALVLNTQPDKPTVKRVIHTTRTTQTADANGILPSDLNAHFPRYAAGSRDPFVAGVVLPRQHLVKAAAPSPLGGARTGWALTGINSVNGVASALIENSATGESVFLQPGDRWNGLRVVSIKPDRVEFQNGLGRQDTLTFAQPPDDKTAAAGGVTVPTAPGLPGSALTLPPYPVSPLRVQSASGSPSSLPALPPLTSAPPQPEDNGPPPGPAEDQ